MLRHLIAEREEELPVSTIGRLLAVIEQRRDVISLGAGELDYPAPRRVIAAATRALARGKTHYSPPQGQLQLREALASKLRKENRIRVEPEQVLVTNGATEGILLSLMCSIDPGEGVLIPDPGFLAFTPCVEVLSGMPLPFRLHESDGFRYRTEELERAIIPEKTRVLIVNTPSNPTGTILGKKALEEVADFAVENDLLILADEAYEKFVYGERHVSMASLNGMADRTVTLHSFSKSYAMPGFRVGYASGPARFIQAMAKMHVFTSICASPVSQAAALEALKEKAQPRRMVAAYDRRRKALLRRVNEIPGISCVEPRGAFYLFPNISSLGKRSLAFAELLLEKAKVAVVPGSEFGRGGEGHVRMSYATPLPKLEEAAQRIRRFVETL